MDLRVFVCLSAWASCGLGITLSPCGRDGTAEVIAGQTDNTFVCGDVDPRQAITWELMFASILYNVSCPSQSNGDICEESTLRGAGTASMESTTESSFVLDPTQLNDPDLLFAQSSSLTCSESGVSATCDLDYVVPAQGSCRIQTGTGQSRFQLKGTCSLQPGTSSSRGRYGCDWYRGGQSAPLVSKRLTANTYHRGCAVTLPLPTVSGNYSYYVILTPGRQNVSAGVVQIERPAAPTLPTCLTEGDYVPEDTSVVCTCSTDNIGTPPARLQWIQATAANKDQVLFSGDYGRANLTVKQPLRRGDHMSTQFACIVDGVTDIPGPYIDFSVGYPPTDVTITLNSQTAPVVKVVEHQTVRFQCQSADGRPPPTVALLFLGNNTQLTSGESVVTRSAVVSCEDSGLYQCTADNRMGPAESTTYRQLTVSCSPRAEADLGAVNFFNQPVSVSFDVTAYPVPHSLTFTYLGPSPTDTGAAEINRDEIGLKGSCKAKPGTIYLSTCQVTVNNVTTESAVGFYTVTVTNTQGSGQFRLKVVRTADRGPRVPDSYRRATIGLSLTLAIIVIAIIALVVWLWRRQWVLPCAQHAGEPDNQLLTDATDRKTVAPPGEHQGPVPPPRPPVGGLPENASNDMQPGANDMNNGGSTPDYLEIIPTSPTSIPEFAAPSGPYAQLQMNDVGQRSIYSQIGDHGDQGNHDYLTPTPAAEDVAEV